MREAADALIMSAAFSAMPYNVLVGCALSWMGMIDASTTRRFVVSYTFRCASTTPGNIVLSALQRTYWPRIRRRTTKATPHHGGGPHRMPNGGEACYAGLHDPLLPVRIGATVAIVWDSGQSWGGFADRQCAVQVCQQNDVAVPRRHRGQRSAITSSGW